MHEAGIEAAKPDAERETAYRERNLPFLLKRLAKRLADLHPPHEAALLRRAAAAASQLPLGLLPTHAEALEQLATALEAAPLDSRSAWPPLAALGAAELESALKGGAGGAEGLKGDAAVGAAAALYPAYAAERDATKALLSPYLPISPRVSSYLPIPSRSSPYLRTSPHISPYLPTSPHVSPHLPTSPHTSPYLPIPPHTSPYFPIPPHISPYLPISPHISQGAALRARPARRGAARAPARG